MKKLFILAAFVTFGFGLNATDSDIVVSGFISNTSGDPVTGATVTCQETSVSSKPSDFEGFYSVPVPRSKKSTLTFSHRNYASQSHSINSSSNTTLDAVMSSSSN